MPMLGLPRWLSNKESACQYRRHGSYSRVRKMPWRRKGQPTLVAIPAWEIPGTEEPGGL